MLYIIQTHLHHLKTSYNKSKEERTKRVIVLKRVAMKEIDYLSQRLKNDYKILHHGKE